jgi:YD repeat-containing protein
MKRVLLVSHQPIGERMAGPGIRYFHFAKELSRRFHVTLLTPNPDAPEIDGVDVVAGKRPSYGTVKTLAARHDIVVAQHFGVRTMRHLATAPVRVVYDLYVPFVTENLVYHATQQRSHFHRLSYHAADLVQSIALATGDTFICASERQRDLWLGRASALERFGVEQARRDPTLRCFLGVVPLGIEEQDPERSRPVLKGVVPGIRESDRVVLWAGGAWNWFDPLTVIRAVGELSHRRDDIKLYFLGLRHPSPAAAEMEMTQRAVDLARELGLEGRYVFFNFDWRPYRERGAYLLEADLGLCAHFDTVETRFAFRTRVLDHLWARLPTVTTRGDTLAELVERENLGRTTDFEDVEGWVTALESMLDDAEEYGRVRANVDRVRRLFTWSNVVEPLAELIADDGPLFPRSPYTRALVRRYVRVQAQVAVQRPRLVLHHLRAR